jgi:hypothetical protein
MAAMPELAPANRNRLLASTSVITKIEYKPDSICYMTFDPASEETLRLMKKPKKVAVDRNELSENNINDGKGWNWKKLEKGGVLTIIKAGGPNVVISF